MQDKVNRYKDLCQQAIIFGEEKDLLILESYDIAVGTIKEALQVKTMSRKHSWR